MDLVLLDIWSFGEVHKIRKPIITTTTTTTMVVIPKNAVTASDVSVITGNVLKTVPCSVPVKRIVSSTDRPTKKSTRSSVYDMHTRPTPKKVTQCTSGRKRAKVDYSQFELGIDDPPSPPKRKRTVDLKRKPSATGIATEKFKTKPSNTPQPIRKASSVHVPVTMSVTSPKQMGATASTSHTLTTPATQQETTDDIPDVDPDDDTMLPIAPQLQQPPQVTPKVEGPVDTDIKPPLLP